MAHAGKRTLARPDDRASLGTDRQHDAPHDGTAARETRPPFHPRNNLALRFVFMSGTRMQSGCRESPSRGLETGARAMTYFTEKMVAFVIAIGISTISLNTLIV